MIQVEHIVKEFVSPKKYPGLKGAIKGLFFSEKVHKLAVDDISFSIDEGEIVGYIGSNGAGKSTTIKMMTGILTPSKGRCLINGVDPSKERMKNAKNIGVVFGQRTQLWWDLPLSESYTILKEIYDVSDEDYEERMAFLNKVLDLPAFFDRPVRTLSLGQRMRADLGAALIHNPKVLYLDEPTIGLDLVVKDKIRDAIREINEKYHTTVILTTHDIGDIEELCNRIIVIDEGHKIYDGGLEQLKDTYGTRRSVIMEVRSVSQVRKIDWSKLLDVDASLFSVETEEENNQLMISFDKNDLQISDVISAAMRATEVKDIKIQETELSKGILAVDAIHILLFFVSVVAGAVIYTSVKLFFASIAFWVKQSGPFLQVAYGMADFAKYPTEIYAKAIRFIITWVIPFAFVAYLPASYFLMGHSALGTIGVECMIAVLFWGIAYALFQYGTTKYESAGN